MAEHGQHRNFPTVETNTLYVGEGVCVKGDLSVPGVLVVDGQIEGNVTARAVWVSQTGSIKGTIAATEAEIHGAISETIAVKQLLVVHPTGRLSGDVRYGQLQLEKGAVISGTLACISAQEEAVEPMLGKSERPKVLHRIEPPKPLNGSGNGLTNGAGLHAGLPPADYRVAS